MFILGAFAWFWIIFGIIFLINPEKFRKALQSKGYSAFKKYLFLIIVFTSLLLINLAFRSSAVAAKVLAALGIIGMIKAFFILKSKAAEKIFDWFGKRPVKFLRSLAIFYIAIVIIILYFNK